MIFKHKIIPYNPILKERARELRNNMTKPEQIVWSILKNKKMSGFDFDRQKPILNYIVDFYCKELLLAIEIDGYSHEHAYEYDLRRENELNEYGIQVLRFSNKVVSENLIHVQRAVRIWIENYTKKNNLVTL